MSEDNYKHGIHERYRQDPLKADERLRGRKTDPVSRRSFLQNTGLAAMSTALAPSLPCAAFMSAGRIPAAFANAAAPFSIADQCRDPCPSA